jgi:hypothetical protein
MRSAKLVRAGEGRDWRLATCGSGSSCPGESGRGGSGRGRRRAGFFATFTAHDSRRSMRGQLYGVTVEVQLSDLGQESGDGRRHGPP